MTEEKLANIIAEKRPIHLHIAQLGSEPVDTNGTVERKCCVEDWKLNGRWQIDALAALMAELRANKGKVLGDVSYCSDPISENNPWGDLGTFRIEFQPPPPLPTI